jgi:folylpolyglutamate synthase/dihydropteroate synthase
MSLQYENKRTSTSAPDPMEEKKRLEEAQVEIEKAT